MRRNTNIPVPQIQKQTTQGEPQWDRVYLTMRGRGALFREVAEKYSFAILYLQRTDRQLCLRPRDKCLLISLRYNAAIPGPHPVSQFRMSKSTKSLKSPGQTEPIML